MRFDVPTADELPLVFDSWARSFRKSPYAGCIPNHLYDSVSRACIGEILDRGARVIVAAVDLEGGGRRVAGYSVSEPSISVLHYLYVKADYRLGGHVERELRDHTLAAFDPEATPRYTHRTPALERLLRGWVHDPVPARVKP